MVYVFYKLGFTSWFCFVVQAFNSVVCTILEACALHRNVKYNMADYFLKTYGVAIGTSLLAAVLPVMVIIFMPSGFIRLMVTCCVSVASSAFIILYVGLSKSQRIKAIQLVKNKIHR